MSIQIPDKREISLVLATELIKEQFPQWAHLSIKPVEPMGWDNRTFRLGEKMLIRLPSAQEYAEQVLKEQKWLLQLAADLSIFIPAPLALGQPSKNYPWNWSVYRWIEGENADTLHENDVQQFALDIAQFLHELHNIDASDGPLAGAHNFFRGASPLVYDDETRAAIAELKNLINVKAATRTWEKAIGSQWKHKPVWIHGDFSVGNILVKEGRLAAVIDFGGMGVGDPACDLVIAWTFLTQENRQLFRSRIELDADTWARARGWALWKALITLVALEDKTCPQALEMQRIIDEILQDDAAFG